MTDTDPQANPLARTDDGDAQGGGDFSADPRTVGAGRGWDWIVEGWELFRKQPGLWILTVVILGILCIAVSMIPVLGSLANALLVPILGGGLMLGCRALERGEPLEINHLFAGFKQRTGDLVMVGVFSLVGWLVIMLAVMAVIGGGVVMAMLRGGAPGAGISLFSFMLAALLIAGLSLPLYMATWFAPALIVLHETPPGAALKASFRACVGNWLPFLVYGVVLLVFGIVAMIPAGLGFLVLMPVLIGSVFASCRDIFRSA